MDKPLLPVSLDWVVGLMLGTVRRGLVTWGVGTELGTEIGPGGMVVIAIELVTILWTGGFDSTAGRASATVWKQQRKRET